MLPHYLTIRKCLSNTKCELGFLKEVFAKNKTSRNSWLCDCLSIHYSMSICKNN